MTNVELVEKIQGFLKGSKAKAKKIDGLVAVNFTFIDDEIQDLYVAVKEGVIDVAPYHYDDLQVNVHASSETVLKLFSGELSFEKAAADGLIEVKGDTERFMQLQSLVPAKKAAPEKTAEAKTEAKKPVAKKAVEAKAAEEKPAAKKPAAKKTAKK